MPDLPAGSPIAALNLAQVGGHLVALLAASASMGHESVRDTVSPYVHKDQLSPEALFVADMFSLPVPELAAKWFGSELEAGAWATNRLVEVFTERGEDSDR